LDIAMIPEIRPFGAISIPINPFFRANFRSHEAHSRITLSLPFTGRGADDNMPLLRTCGFHSRPNASRHEIGFCSRRSIANNGFTDRECGFIFRLGGRK
jgi:hypothetical protein